MDMAHTWCLGGHWFESSQGLKGRDPFNHNPDRSDREKCSTSKGGPIFSKLFQLDQTDPLSFGMKFPEILVEWIAPKIFALFHAQVLSREAPPKVKPLTFLYTIFGRKCILPNDKMISLSYSRFRNLHPF